MKLTQFFESKVTQQELFDKLTEDENSDMNTTKPPGKMGDYMNTAQCAVELGVSMSRVRQMVAAGQIDSIPPEKGKRDHTFTQGAVDKAKKFMEKERRTGRPKGS